MNMIIDGGICKLILLRTWCVSVYRRLREDSFLLQIEKAIVILRLARYKRLHEHGTGRSLY